MLHILPVQFVLKLLYNIQNICLPLKKLNRGNFTEGEFFFAEQGYYFSFKWIMF